jgi:hypothetical protein
VSGGRFHLTFPEHLIDEPLIYRLGRDFGVVTNIRRANVEERAAWVILEIRGEQADVERALAWLAERGVQVDRIET